MKISVLVIITAFVLKTCNQEAGMSHIPNPSEKHLYTNKLAGESSPYLLQHAHNPVNWYPWGEEALNKAKEEDKLLLISIGYAACHWCHVMERETFENVELAALMNEKYVCIKVDREERPDIDQIYMNAVQLMTGSGGWPLNCFALPDQRPIYGGTYFRAEQWRKVLESVDGFYRDNKGKALEYADNLTRQISTSELIVLNEKKPDFTKGQLKEMVDKWSGSMDNKEGGPNRAPKFPLPNNYQFLLRYYHHDKNEKLLKHVKLTLKKMAFGGIYDQIGGGFARYSTDTYWKVPHFEKMLYDNGQLVSLYSEAYQALQDPLYKQIVHETLEYIQREMTGSKGNFYSSLDADSEGEEGKFYVWTRGELEEILGDDLNILKDYFNVNQNGLWEHDNYILLRDKEDADIAKDHGISVLALSELVKKAKKKILEVRRNRVRPGLDDKTLASWNAIMLKGYADAYAAFGDKSFLDAALKNAAFLLGDMRKKDRGLYHNYKNGKSSINGYLEDYSFTIQALLRLYEVTIDEKWLFAAKDLADYAIKHFIDSESGMFYFTSDEDPKLLARKMEVNDNVIPASNSSMALGLHRLGAYFDNEGYSEMAIRMLNNVSDHMVSYGSGYSNWGIFYLNMLGPFYEVAVVGKNAEFAINAINKKYLPQKLIVGAVSDHTNLSLLENKLVKDKTMIYVCQNKVCKLPVEKVEDAIKQINFE